VHFDKVQVFGTDAGPFVSQLRRARHDARLIGVL